MRSTHVGLLLAVTTALVMACNALLGLDELSPYDGASEGGVGSSGLPSGSSGDGSVVEDADTPDALVDSGGGTVGDAGVAPCDPTELPDESIGIFVKSGGTNGDGRMNSPFNSVAAAIGKLQVNDGGVDTLADAGDGGSPKTQTIYVYAGGYTETAALVIDGVLRFRIDGAWGGPLLHWTRDCSASRSGNTVINSARPRGIVVRNVPGPSMISNLSLFTAAEQNSDPSRIGIHIIDSGPLTLYNTNIIAENAVPAMPPLGGGHGQQVCDDVINVASCTVNPVDGAAGDPGANGDVGVFGKLGYTAAGGAKGHDGVPGKKAAPTAAVSMGCAESCSSTPVASCADAPLTVEHGETGTCGCGGAEGWGGEGGPGGGASVAILSNGVVNVEYTILQSKKGGNGIPGAAGGNGVAGNTGLPGAAYPDCLTRCCADTAAEPAVCVDQDVGMCSVEPVTLAGGQPRTGSTGGNGGNGGNGAGGPSYTVVLLQGGEANFLESSRTYGAGGIGANPAPNGESGAILGPLVDVDAGP